MTRDPLTPEQVAMALVDLPCWTGDPTGLTRTVTCPDFRAAIRLVVAVGEVAEELDHHPDIDVRYRDVTLRTHTAGGVTSYDVELARRVDGAVTLAGC